MCNKEKGILKEKLTINDIKRMKIIGEKISVTTAYDYVMAKIVDEAGIDIILVGGSLGMILLGYKNTVPVTQQDIEHHLRPVVRAIKRSVVVAPLSFGAYQISNEQAIRNAIRLMQIGANSVKTQGAGSTINRIKAIVKANIPCMGHAGLTPQYISQIGGFRAVGKFSNEAKKVYEDCLAIQEAGAWAIELECVPYEVAKLISKKLTIPIIGTGSGIFCDGQYLNLYDALGLLKSFKPRFAKRYINLFNCSVEALKKFKKDVKEKKYPTEDLSIKIPEKELENFKEEIKSLHK